MIMFSWYTEKFLNVVQRELLQLAAFANVLKLQRGHVNQDIHQSTS